MILVLSACGTLVGKNSEISVNNSEVYVSEEVIEESLTFGSTFGLGKLEITIGDNVTWAKTEQTYFEH